MNSRYNMPPERRVRKRTGIRVFLLLVILLIALAASNPVKSDFSEYAMNNLEETLGMKLNDGVSNMIGQPMVESFTRRENYIVFSMFSVPDIQDGKTFIGDITATQKYLGFLKIIFIKL